MRKYQIWIITILLPATILALFPSHTLAASISQQDDPKARADALYQEGVALYNQASYQEALERLETALAIYKDIDDKSDEGLALNMLGLVHNDIGQYDEALDYYNETLRIEQSLGDKEGQGRTLNNMGLVYYNQGSYAEALDTFQKSLAIARELDDRQAEGAILSGIGAVYSRLGQYPQSLDYFQQSLAIAQEIGDREAEGGRLNNVGSVYYHLGQYPQALDNFRQALTIAQELDDRAWEVTILGNLGGIYQALGEYQKALDYEKQALSIAHEIGYRAGESATLNGLGQIYASLGDYEQELSHYQKALAIDQEIGDRHGEAVALNGMSGAYTHLGQYEQALNRYQQALAIEQEIGDRHGEAATLNGIGQTYTGLGNYRQALEYHQQALTIVQEIGDLVGEAAALGNIGLMHNYLGEFEQALEIYQQSLASMQTSGDRRGEATILNNIGLAHENLSQYAQSLDDYQRALAIEQELGDQEGKAATLSNIGLVYEDLSQPAQALDYYQKTLKIQLAIGDRAGQAETFTALGQLKKKQGENSQAMKYSQQAVDLIESIHSELKIEELKTSFASQYANAYELLIELLWDAGRFQDAFNYVERARARAFLDQLAGGSIDFRSGVDPNLLKREQSLRAEITALQAQIVSLRNHPTNELDLDAISSVETDLKARESDYAQVLTNIKLQSPEVAGLVSVDVASLADIQSLLDLNTTLVEYFVTDERVLAFIVTHDKFKTAKIDASREDLAKTITSFRDFASLNDPYPASLTQLYAWLIAPLKDNLKTPIVGIIPHGVLHYLPFAALTDGQQYLGNEYSLFTLPSASTLRFIQAKRKPATNTILALGNPTTTEPGLSPLDFAQQEVATITKIFGSEPLIGDLATESALRSKAGNAGIIHLAAHGQYNPENPLFSQIYLAADQQNDGRLEVNEIYSLDLTKATDLVVLSACQTDVGAVSAGDEVVGMTRAFLSAGTPTVIASLWNVDDKATTLLMERFYSHLRDGMGKAQALQQAQREVQAQFPNPYYWAAFVLTGDPGKTVPMNSMQRLLENNRFVWAARIAGVLLLVVVILGGVLVRRRQRNEAKV